MWSCLRLAASPLRWRPIHDDVHPQDLHGIEGAGQVAHGGQGDEAQGSDAPTGHRRQAAHQFLHRDGMPADYAGTSDPAYVLS